jgi:hypothetical protein
MQVVTGTAMELSNTGALELRPFPWSGCEERMPECNGMPWYVMLCYAMQMQMQMQMQCEYNSLPSYIYHEETIWLSM